MKPRPQHRARTASPDPAHDPSPSEAASPQDARAVLDVMDRELQRSVSGLRVPGSPRPYYLDYSWRRSQELRLRAAHGAVTVAREFSDSRIFVDVRVGNHKFDNVIDGGLNVRAEERESADWIDGPHDHNLEALQIALWKLTQIKFDEAIADYYDHRKTTVTEYLRDEIDAFTQEPAVVCLEALPFEDFPRAKWEDALRRISAAFLAHPEIYDPFLELRAARVHRYFVNTEGTRIATGDVYIEADVGGWILTEDGVYCEASRHAYVRSLDAAPGEERLKGLVEEVFADLRELAHAPSAESFIGPVLLAGEAASTLFHEALGHRLEGERLVARGETRTFSHKRGQRILPAGLDVYDDPSVPEMCGQPIWGSYRFDDQGVPAQRAVLIEDGTLVGYLTSRAPVPGGRRSNGHGRHDGLQPRMARMGNLVVEARPGYSRTWDELMTELVSLAKAQGRKHAMVVTRIRAGETSTSSYDFQAFKGEPSEVYRIDVETGHKERVRDLEIIGTPLSALQRIVSFGGTPGVDQGYCYAESGSIPVSGVAPAILLSELEMQQASTSGYHEPLLPPPFADDGSRGRTGNVRDRGRRRRGS